MSFQRTLLGTLLLVFSVVAWAQPEDVLLNKIQMQLNAEKWVTTQTALVTVLVNATVQTQGIDKITLSVMDNLKKMSPTAKWNVVSLTRREDKSGLESIQIRAQGRLQQKEVSDVRGKAKLVSTPGAAFTVENIRFTPSQDDLRAAEAELRTNIYEQTKAEIDRLNKIYPNEKYYLHSIDFSANMPRPMPMAMYARTNVAASPAPQQDPLSIGNKKKLVATVVIGSLPGMHRKGLPPNL